MAMPVASGKVYGCLKKNFLRQIFRPRKKTPTTKGSLVAKIPLVTKTAPQEKSRRNEDFARNENFAARKISPQRKFREQYYRQYYRQQNFAHDKKGFF